MKFRHISVMPKEVLHYLSPKQGGTYVDGTLGGSGHSFEIAGRIQPGGRLIGIDQDIDAIENGRIKLAEFGSSVSLVRDTFSNLPEILSGMGIDGVDGILVDLGLSLHQIEKSGRGFSFRKNEPLDMRMDIRRDLTAADIVNGFDEKKLSEIFKTYGEEKFAWRIAKAIARERQKSRIDTSMKLAEIVKSAVPGKVAAKSRIHPATRVFMALRIVINSEIDRLKTFMDSAADLLNPGGRLCVLSFHSLEDRIVKQTMKALEKGCTCPPDFPQCVCGKKQVVRCLTRKAVMPTEEEVRDNPMSRSTRLRAMEKI